MYNRFILSILLVASVMGLSPLNRPVLSNAPDAKTILFQEEERVVERLSRKQPPLKIGTIKRKKGEIFLGKKFIDKEDWFEGLSVELKNTSGKNIIYIGAGFLFPRQTEAAGQAPPLYKSFHYGLHPSAPRNGTLDPQPLLLKPGEKISLTLSDLDYSDVADNLRRLKYTHSIKVIKLSLQEIYFEDGTSWAGGTYFSRGSQGRSNVTPERQVLGGVPRNILATLSSNSRNTNPLFFTL